MKLLKVGKTNEQIRTTASGLGSQNLNSRSKRQDLGIPSFLISHPLNLKICTWKDSFHLAGVVDDPVPWLDDALEHGGCRLCLLPTSTLLKHLFLAITLLSPCYHVASTLLAPWLDDTW